MDVFKIPMDVVNKREVMFSPTGKKETCFPWHYGFLKDAHSRLLWDCKPFPSSDPVEEWFQVGPKHKKLLKNLNRRLFMQQPLDQSGWDKMWKISSTLQMGKTVLPAVSARKVSWEIWGWGLGFWSQKYKVSEACPNSTGKEIVAVYEGVQAAS